MVLHTNYKSAHKFLAMVEFSSPTKSQLCVNALDCRLLFLRGIQRISAIYAGIFSILRGRS